ncbi:hypothetical protein ACFQ3L_09265 [Lacticaseibacillus jixianensis]|uniref:ABC transporter permease n=1 Tax=Lacticaseibacillus jixianensis TaxID=2486012 RepID=A0ABW4BAI4_9LACO|nr:hypothetical protein [Lacticaseibacillus jixianensis]
MTSTSKVFWQMTKERVRQVTQLIEIDLGVIAVLVVMRLIGRLSSEDVLGFSTLFGLITVMVGFVAQAQSQEQVWVQNRWRLVPLADWKLYCASTLANLATSVYLWAVIAAVTTVEVLVSGVKGYWSNTNLVVLASVLVLILVMLMLLWTLISLEHMLTTMITDFLPGMQEKWLRRVIILVSIVVSLKLIDWFVDGITWLVNRAGITGASFNSSVTINGSGMVMHGTVLADLWLTIIMFAGAVLILSVLNCYLLSHWVETKQTPAAV